MALGALVRTVTLAPVGGTKDGSLTITAPAAGAKIVGVMVKTASPEFFLRGITLSDTTATAGTLLYDCYGKSGTSYSVTLTVTDYDAD